MPSPYRYNLGDSLDEEVAACILGGFGIPSEIALAAFRRLQARNLIAPNVPEAELAECLEEPLVVGGRRVRYRFARQRAHRLSGALKMLRAQQTPSEAAALRRWLIDLPGVGPKTASWIVRNHLGAGDVAIVDIHLMRAGIAAGFFRPDWRVPRDYALFEAAFMAYAAEGNVSAPALDACIWGQLHALGSHGKWLLEVATRARQTLEREFNLERTSQ